MTTVTQQDRLIQLLLDLESTLAEASKRVPKGVICMIEEVLSNASRLGPQKNIIQDEVVTVLRECLCKRSQ